MKIIKILSLVLSILLLGSMFIGCEKETTAATELPKDDYYNSWDENTVTVSFRIQFEDSVKDDKGNPITVTKVLMEAVDYEYKSHKAPTILNIITNYMAVEEGFNYKVDNGILKKIGKYPNNKSQKGMYWAFAAGIGDEMGQKIDESMNTYNVIENNCLEFTVYLSKV